MKYFFLFLSFLFVPVTVSAETAYLKEFNVANGILSIPFNEQNNIYTIYLAEDAKKVEFTYSLEDPESTIEIIDDSWEEEKENIMLVKVKSKNELESQVYTFYLEKEVTQSVALDTNMETSLNVTKRERSPYLIPIIGILYILIVFSLFYILIIRYLKPRKRIRKHHLHRIQ